MFEKSGVVHSSGAGDVAFCTGGNPIEYSEYHAPPERYGKSMDLFDAIVDSILNCKKVEAFLGFPALSTREMTGRDTTDFLKYRQLVAESAPMDGTLFELMIGRPRQS